MKQKEETFGESIKNSTTLKIFPESFLLCFFFLYTKSGEMKKCTKIKILTLKRHQKSNLCIKRMKPIYIRMQICRERESDYLFVSHHDPFALISSSASLLQMGILLSLIVFL
jgi:hypothetical protein